MNLKPFYETNKKYSITLNPQDKYQFFGKPDRFRRFRNHVYENLLHLDANEVDYELIIEISEPHEFKTVPYQGPRLHMHGVILFKNISSLGYFLTTGYTKIIKWSSIDIDTIGDMDKWISYCKKQHIFKNNRLSNSTKEESSS